MSEDLESVKASISAREQENIVLRKPADGRAPSITVEAKRAAPPVEPQPGKSSSLKSMHIS